jgi:hypothetical protein
MVDFVIKKHPYLNLQSILIQNNLFYQLTIYLSSNLMILLLIQIQIQKNFKVPLQPQHFLSFKIRKH